MSNKKRKRNFGGGFMARESLGVIDAATQARRAYQREWRAKNKDKVRKHNKAYWAKKGNELLKEKQKEGG
jgi:hypothetical protein